MSCLIENIASRSLTSAMALLLLSALVECPRAGESPPVSPQKRSGTSYYLDCSASQNGDGTRSSPWNSVSTANAFTLRPGDHLLLKRGTACAGPLTPRGSGAANSAITIDAYGTGTQPVISGGSAEEALKLFNQQYWEINNLEITGGKRYGVYVSGDIPRSSINHIYLRNLNVHNATYTSTWRSDSGEVFLSTRGAGQILNDVLIDGVTAHDSHVSEGIFVSAGGAWIEKDGAPQPLGSNVTVQNSTAHDIYGDGILIAEVKNGLVQRNVVYHSGLCPKCTGSTPVGLWEWYCHTCTVQFNESYANQSWGGDGGDFDIDFYDDNNIVQYNYGHDSAGYCVAIYGAGGRVSHDNIFRFNVCANDGRRGDLSKQGEVYLHTWDGGSLDGVQIYNNTIYWNPASNAAAFTSDAVYSGSDPRFFKNNIVYATVPGMIQITSGIVLDNNIYWTTASAGNWQIGGAAYTSFGDYKLAEKQDAHSFYADPKLSDADCHSDGRPTTALHLLTGSPASRAGANVCSGISGCSMGTQDFWGDESRAGHVYDIGAYQEP